MTHKRLSLIAAVAMLAALVFVVPRPAEATTVVHDCIPSVDEPDGTPVEICFTVFQPATASPSAPVPLVFHSHGWGGSRLTAVNSSIQKWMDAGFGVLSFDQRGFGESGGQAHIENPEFEGQDVRALVDYVAGLGWVIEDAPGDPRIGAIGGSYGGGYQFVGAFTDLRDNPGGTRFDALAPEITWFDLQQSLAPERVVRTAWVTALYAAGSASVPNEIHQAFIEGAATGEWPDGTGPLGADADEFFDTTGPKWHVSEGRQLDIPVLFGQGTTDNLFNLNQGLSNWDHALTAGARAESIFIGYNGGHALPQAFPPSQPVSGDSCSPQVNSGAGAFEDLAISFFKEKLKGQSGLIASDDYGRYHIASASGTCMQLDALGTPTPHAIGTAVTTTGAGPYQNIKLADGPLRVAGVPTVEADVTALGLDARAFFALSMGVTAADARVVQDNVMPIHEHDTLPGETNARTIELPGVAVDVPPGQSLFLSVSPVSDMSFGHGSRTPGGLLLENTVVQVPLLPHVF